MRERRLITPYYAAAMHKLSLASRSGCAFTPIKSSPEDGLLLSGEGGSAEVAAPADGEGHGPTTPSNVCEVSA